MMYCFCSPPTWMLEHSNVDHLTVYFKCPVCGVILSRGHVEHVGVYVGHPPYGRMPARGYVEHLSDELC